MLSGRAKDCQNSQTGAAPLNEVGGNKAKDECPRAKVQRAKAESLGTALIDQRRQVACQKPKTAELAAAGVDLESAGSPPRAERSVQAKIILGA